ncbi:MAG TPA: TrpB-like pyridoxal phosphate-dependent enzyme [Candidatus Sumerlaeota bacterium]|nr:TrpB-like pyridoxal phosphate-dependent enzyme [Candidatus Sumerlaeota bacterium]HOR26985.1 TrpB-like pyridoxal phosphate-dependent enzyme [Candidatus Sumerlaeota bacterium]HPK02143.1 TrpB-like pyridoxal phosphate-dependent enzyme [Candidatus Sumerlaeota bacterium]
MDEKKIILPERELPTHWYNLAADLPEPLQPPRHPATHAPLTPAELAPLFAEALIEQELSTERWIEIPTAVREAYRVWRPSPLFRATGLEAALETPAEIWCKWEGVSPAGSHKPNSAIPQAYYNAREGIRRLTTETGAGQWGSSLAYACAQFGLECTVYMVRISFSQKPYRASLMRAWGATVFPSPSDQTGSGRAALAEDPETNGSLGIAISEAVEDAVAHDDAHYALGSVLNHVLLHQTIIGLETQKQFKRAGREPDVLVGCVGGGSNFAGFVFPYIPEKLGGHNLRLVAVEPAACPTLTRGRLAYDYGDTAGLTPLIRMHTLGSHFMPPGFHAGGLRYHGMAPMVSAAVEQGLVEPVAIPQLETFEAGLLFARTEGIMPAPEACHAIRAAIIEAERCKAERKKEIIAVNVSGHGHMDMAAFDAYLSGKLVNQEHDEQALALSLSHLPAI